MQNLLITANPSAAPAQQPASADNNVASSERFGDVLARQRARHAEAPGTAAQNGNAQNNKQATSSSASDASAAGGNEQTADAQTAAADAASTLSSNILTALMPTLSAPGEEKTNGKTRRPGLESDDPGDLSGGTLAALASPYAAMLDSSSSMQPQAAMTGKPDDSPQSINPQAAMLLSRTQNSGLATPAANPASGDDFSVALKAAGKGSTKATQFDAKATQFDAKATEFDAKGDARAAQFEAKATEFDTQDIIKAAQFEVKAAEFDAKGDAKAAQFVTRAAEFATEDGDKAMPFEARHDAMATEFAARHNVNPAPLEARAAEFTARDSDNTAPFDAKATQADASASLSAQPQGSAAPVAASQAAPAHAAISTPLSHRAWGDEFSQKITWLANQHEQSAELHLNPPQLGPLDVVIKVSGDQATALFTSPHAAVRDAVEQALPKLREMLSDNGIMLGNATVSDQSPKEQQAWLADKQPSGKGRLAMETGSAADSLPSGVTAVPARRHRGLLDTFA